jgi:hypothetical protein
MAQVYFGDFPRKWVKIQTALTQALPEGLLEEDLVKSLVAHALRTEPLLLSTRKAQHSGRRAEGVCLSNPLRGSG